jgi:hypothetical protein
LRVTSYLLEGLSIPGVSQWLTPGMSSSLRYA